MKGSPEGTTAISQPLEIVEDYSAAVQLDQPVGYWRLGETSGATVNDSSPTRNHGTWFATPLLDTQGALIADRNGAPFFDPSMNNYVRVPHVAAHATQKFSLEAWFTIPSTLTLPASFTALFLKTTPDATPMDDGYGIYWQGQNLHFYVNDQNTRVSVAFPAGKGTVTTETLESRFHHIVATYDPTLSDGKNMKLYLDGRLVGTRAYTAALNAGTGELLIGKGRATQGWYGKIDEAAKYDSALSEGRVVAHFQAGNGFPKIPVPAPGWIVSGTTPTYANVIAVPPCGANCEPPPAACPGFRPATLYETAKDLRDTLTRMTGQTFTIQQTTTPPADSIRLIRTQGYTPANATEQKLIADLTTRDLLAFAAVSDVARPVGLKIFGTSDVGIQAGVYHYLRLLGSRWIIPNARWKIVPSRSNIRWGTARVEEPDLRWGLDVYASGGFPCAYPAAVQAGMTAVKSAFETWRAHNQLYPALDGYGDTGIAGQIGAGFNVRNSAPSDPCDTMGDTCVPGSTTCSPACNGARISHPEWRAHFAEVPATPTTPFVPAKPTPWLANGVYAWQIAGNTSFQDFFAADRLAYVALAHAADPFSPAASVVSAQGAEGTSPPEDQHPRALALGNAIDNRLTLANHVARKLKTTYPAYKKYAGVFAYSSHAAPPRNVVPDSNTIVLVVPYGFQSTGYSGDQLVSAWSAKAPALGIYDYWAYAEGAQDQPMLDFVKTIPDRLRLLERTNFNHLIAETTTAGGVVGFPFSIAGLLAWNTRLLDERVRASLLDDAFCLPTGCGLTRVHMSALLERWTRSFMLGSNELALSLNDMKIALDNAPAGSEVRARVVDFAAYVHYLALFTRYVANGSTETDADATIKYLWQVNDRAMLNAYALTTRVFGRGRTNLLTKWGRTGTGWSTVTPLTDQQIVDLIQGDLTSFPMTANVFVPEAFTGSITPFVATTPAPITSTTAPTSNVMYTSSGRVAYVYARQAGATLSFDALHNGRLHVVLTDPLGAVIRDEWLSPTGAWRTISFVAPIAGAYSAFLTQQAPQGEDSPVINSDTLQLSAGRPGGVINQTPFAIAGPFYGNGSPNNNPITGTPAVYPAYFYVPVGTKKFAVTSGGQVPCSVIDPNGVRTACTGWTLLDATGKDGKVWTLAGTLTAAWKGSVSLVGVPNLISLHPDQVLKQAK